MTSNIANDLLVSYDHDGAIASVCVNPDDDAFDEVINFGAAFAFIPAGSPASDMERLAPKSSDPSPEKIQEALEADYLAESETLANFQTKERAHASAIAEKLQQLFRASCRIALINPDRPNAKFIIRVSTAHDQLMLQASAYGGLYSDIYCVLEADEFSLRRYVPAPGKRFSLAAAAYVRRCLYKFAFGQRWAPSSSEQRACSKVSGDCPTWDEEDAHYLTTHIALVHDKAELGTVLRSASL